MTWKKIGIDARAAWRLADEFEKGEAPWVGSAEVGGYVLPKIAEHRNQDRSQTRNTLPLKGPG